MRTCTLVHLCHRQEPSSSLSTVYFLPDKWEDAVISLLPDSQPDGCNGSTQSTQNLFLTSFPDAMQEEKQAVLFMVYWI